MTTDYRPREGSKGDLALQHLKDNGRTSRVDLADAADVDPKSLEASIVLTLKHGLIKRERTAEGWFYELGDGTPPADEPDTEAPPAGPVGNGSQKPDDAAAIPGARAGSDTEGRDSQHVLKAGPERADATDRETPANASPRVGAMGAGQAADAATVEIAPRLKRNFKAPRTVGKKPAKSKAPKLPPQTGHDLLLDRAFEAAHPEAPKSTAPRLPPVFWISSDGGYEIRRGGVVTESFTKPEFIAQVAFLAEVQVPAQEAA